MGFPQAPQGPAPAIGPSAHIISANFLGGGFFYQRESTGSSLMRLARRVKSHRPPRRLGSQSSKRASEGGFVLLHFGLQSLERALKQRAQPVFDQVDLVGGDARHFRHFLDRVLFDHMQEKDLVVLRVGLAFE
jgi:hypothetical protein